jgi:phosphatidylinositol-3-phosphatase
MPPPNRRRLSLALAGLLAVVALVLVFAIPREGHTRPGPKGALPTPERPCGLPNRPPKTFAHVVWIAMENKAFSAIDEHAAPYLTKLAAKCGLALNFHAESHPSLPNYLAMTSGSTHGIVDDASPAVHRLGSPSIFSQLHGSWRVLADSMPSNCSREDTDLYAVRHNPPTYYTGLAADCATRDVPLRRPPDLSARFTFIAPNLCHDMHSRCGSTEVRQGDEWLARFMPTLIDSAQYRSGGTVIFVTWDEDDGSTGDSGRIPTIVISPSIRSGTRAGERFDHYALLRTTEELLGVTPYLGEARSASSMRRPFNLAP